jgi:3-hydroxyacyl-CoA dehydrogenase
MNRIIKKVVVLGSGIMGSRIACHFANIGIEVLLLDMVPMELNEEEKAKGISTESKEFRNRLVDSAFNTAINSKPSPLYEAKNSKLIRTGNFEDQMPEIKDFDWIIEVVVENLEIKKKIYDQVEKFRSPGTLVSSNTSGIPIHLMAEGRSDDFKAHFCGTHFFNPPRYLRLLEIIPTPHTDKAVVDFLMHFGDLFLGKTTVLCKDTPAFIANRIGVYSIMSLLHLVEKMDLTVEEVDKFTGTILGRPKSATFRTSDVVGLDTMIHVANGLYAGCPEDESRDQFILPEFVRKMAENRWLGDKTKQGFYKKMKGAGGETEFWSLDLKTLEYKSPEKVKSSTFEAAKAIPDLKARMKVIEKGNDKMAEFFRASFFPLFAYCSHRIPEIADDLYAIDDALRAGFGWSLGPFEVWDALGLVDTVKSMKDSGIQPAAWVEEMLAAGMTSFYRLENGIRKYYKPGTRTFEIIPGKEAYIQLNTLRENHILWENSGLTVLDLGDGILCAEFHTKMNTLGSEVVLGLNKALDLAERGYRGLVIGNDGDNFSAGANVAEMFMAAVDEEWEEINLAVRSFQNTMMRMRYSSIPVVAAPFGLSLGGGCEICLHADFVQAHAETYMGLVEFGVGLIPAGGGSKEFALRASDAYSAGEIDQVILRERFLTIGMAKVSTSGPEALSLGYLKRENCAFTLNRDRLILDAKNKALELAEKGYTLPVPRKDIKVLGREGLGMVNIGAYSMFSGHYISEYDKIISEKLGWVLCGGDLSSPAAVSEQYLLDLEREAFVSLCQQTKTQERIQSILKTGKPLRN